MAKFCDVCEALLIPIYTDEKMAFQCVPCRIAFPPEPVDTLRYEKNKVMDTAIHELALTRAADDPTNIKANIKCINSCGGTIVKQIRVGDDMKLFNTCLKCKTSWLN